MPDRFLHGRFIISLSECIYAFWLNAFHPKKVDWGLLAYFSYDCNQYDCNQFNWPGICSHSPLFEGFLAKSIIMCVVRNKERLHMRL